MSEECLSILIPVYNEEEVLKEFYRRISVVLNETKMKKEIIFIDDGSKNSSLSILKNLQKSDSNIKIMYLLRWVEIPIGISILCIARRPYG